LPPSPAVAVAVSKALVWPDETPEEAVSRHYSQMQQIGFVVLKFLPRAKAA
jgi:hypothetical protein